MTCGLKIGIHVMTRTMIIDTDTASDDAVALIMALRWQDVSVKAITIVAGNVHAEQGAANALYTTELCGSDVPVYLGAKRPLVRPAADAEWFHGRDGLGDMNYPAARRALSPGHAADAMIETIKANPGILLVTLGPLTNVGVALSKAPEIAALVSRCIVMGGAACTVGNVTPAAEYNIWCDPEAAQIVFHSGLPVEMVGWELCRGEANITPQEMQHIYSFNTPLATFAMDCNRRAFEATQKQSGDPGLGLPDPVAMSIALDPTICTRRSDHYVLIETQSELTRGQTVVDELGVSHDERNAVLWQPAHAARKTTICWEIDAPRWKEALYMALR
jgi:purine nucleosidase